MALQDAYPCLSLPLVKTDVASTDFPVTVPYTGRGYTVESVKAYGSRLTTTGATADNSTATVSVRGTAGGAGTSIVADAALTTHTSIGVVSRRTVAATGTTPIVTDPILYVRVGTASGVTNSCISVTIEYSVLP